MTFNGMIFVLTYKEIGNFVVKSLENTKTVNIPLL